MKGFWNMMFGTDDGSHIIEETLNSVPTAGVNDDGAGWERIDDPEEMGVDNWEIDTPIIYQREVRRLHMIPENERDQWQEHTPGWYHKKG